MFYQIELSELCAWGYVYPIMPDIVVYSIRNSYLPTRLNSYTLAILCSNSKLPIRFIVFLPKIPKKPLKSLMILNKYPNLAAT